MKSPSRKSKVKDLQRRLFEEEQYSRSLEITLQRLMADFQASTIKLHTLLSAITILSDMKESMHPAVM
jgi:hypothetical protein